MIELIDKQTGNVFILPTPDDKETKIDILKGPPLTDKQIIEYLLFKLTHKLRHKIKLKNGKNETYR